tara:strand:+ start:539 stop:739 length:201 start_codon:yes stop_codon:yes gene_type:complete
MIKDQPYEKPPQVSAELIKWLDQQFPVVNPEMGDSERLIFHRVGQRSVVEHLEAVFREQAQNVLES